MFVYFAACWGPGNQVHFQFLVKECALLNLKPSNLKQLLKRARLEVGGVL